MLKHKFVVAIFLFNSYLFSQNINQEDINLDIKNSFSKKYSTYLINPDTLKNYYIKEQYASYWIDNNGLKSIAIDFVDKVKNDPVYKPSAQSLFKLNIVDELTNSLDKESLDYSKNLIKLELLLTEIYEKYATYLIKGSINWKEFQSKLKDLKNSKEIDGQWDRHENKSNNQIILKQMIENNDIEVLSKKLDITYPNSKKLILAIDDLEKVIENGDYIKLPSFKTLRLGDYGENVKFLRERLAQSYDVTTTCTDTIVIDKLVTNNTILTSQVSSSETLLEEPTNIISVPCDEFFDEELKQQVISFQKQHGLYADGIVGANTQVFLNKSAKEKISQIRLNIERMRWLPRNFGEKYLLVNIPEYNLKLIENNDIKLDMAVIVGEQKFPTPIFSDNMSYVVLNPTWNIPVSIAKSEVIPKLLKDPNYLVAKGIDIYAGWDSQSEKIDHKDIIDHLILEDGAGLSNFRLAQTPSNNNPLGKMKFMFPNKHAVYLHDTPGKSLFGNARRAYSHGCIRLSQPDKLLSTLADDNKNINLDKVNDILKDNKEKSIGLNQKVPIHIVYLTSWVDNEGILQFREDIYNYDKMQKELLN